MDVIRFALLGLGLGAIYTLLGHSIVVIHRGSGVLNFAAAAVGMFGAYVFYTLWEDHGLPLAVALLLGLASAAAIGALTHIMVMRHLHGAGVTTRIVATLGLLPD